MKPSISLGGLVTRGTARAATVLDKPRRRKVGVRLDIERYIAFKAYAARRGMTGEQVLEQAIDRLLTSDAGPA